MKVLFVASECHPFAKAGGLGDVAGALPKALFDLGLDVRLVLPLYAGMPWRELEVLEGALPVPMGVSSVTAAVRLGRLPGSQVPIYFIEYNRYFDRPFVYGPPGGGYSDNIERFAFLSRAALELAKAIGFIPDIVHANDWQTALVPVYINTVEWSRPLHGSASVFTIHNLGYQGVWDGGALFLTGLGREHYNSGEFEHFGTMNLMKAALAHCTMLTTVSPTYAEEIQTSAHGFGLDGVLRGRRADLRGILNGIDTDEWNPRVDPLIAARYDENDLAGKAACKAALQSEAGLPVRADRPVFGVVGRLIRQKGLDVLAQILGDFTALDAQLVVLGTGDRDLEGHFRYMARLHPDRIYFHGAFDHNLAHRIEAGCDFFLMPSRFEPCGLNQMYSLRYGTLPIVRATGGLADTVVNYDEARGAGTGFMLQDLGPQSLLNTIGWALSTWYDRPAHIDTMRRQAMTQDFSWAHAAKAYIQIYREAYARRRGHPFDEGQGNAQGAATKPRRR
jgi:starch synthase